MVQVARRDRCVMGVTYQNVSYDILEQTASSALSADDFIRQSMKYLAQMKAMVDAVKLAITIPHQMPTKPRSRGYAKMRVKAVVRMTVRNKVTQRAFMPLPTPWNMEEEKIPAAAPG